MKNSNQPIPYESFPYGQLPLSVASRQDISGDAKVCFAMLLMHQNKEDGFCGPSTDKLAAEMGFPGQRRKAERCIKELEDLGIIRRQRRCQKPSSFIMQPAAIKFVLPDFEGESETTDPDASLNSETTDPDALLESETTDPDASLESHATDPDVSLSDLDSINSNENNDLQDRNGATKRKLKDKKKTTDQKNVRSGKKSTSKAPVTASPEAKAELQKWEDKKELPRTANHDACLKVFDDLHRIDRLSWQDIGKINDCALSLWVKSGWMASPCKLRLNIRSGECKVWEKIQRDLAQKQKKQEPEYYVIKNRQVIPSTKEEMEAQRARWKEMEAEERARRERPATTSGKLRVRSY